MHSTPNKNGQEHGQVILKELWQIHENKVHNLKEIQIDTTYPWEVTLASMRE